VRAQGTSGYDSKEQVPKKAGRVLALSLSSASRVRGKVYRDMWTNFRDEQKLEPTAGSIAIATLAVVTDKIPRSRMNENALGRLMKTGEARKPASCVGAGELWRCRSKLSGSARQRRSRLSGCRPSENARRGESDRRKQKETGETS
jgi:hypothetical protein